MTRRTYKWWKPWELEYLRNNYDRLTQAEMAVKLDRTAASINMKVVKLGLHKEVNTGRWKPGHTMQWRGERKPHHTWFKPGNVPATTRKPGVYLLDDHGRKLYMIKHEDGRREPLAHHLWKSANGDIPKGYVVAFKDMNTLNCTLDNLICISRAENLKRIRATLDISAILRRTWRERKGLTYVQEVLQG